MSFFVGSSNGLSLILNIEQYEYMKGPQTDAGVKVSMSRSQYAGVKVSMSRSQYGANVIISR